MSGFTNSGLNHTPLQDIIEAAFLMTNPNDMWIQSDYSQALPVLKLVGAHAYADGPLTDLMALTRIMSQHLSLAANSLAASYEVNPKL
jgi:hypothetical protein